MDNEEVTFSEAQMVKVITDLVDFAREFNKLVPSLVIGASGVEQFILVDNMSKKVLELYTKSPSGEK